MHEKFAKSDFEKRNHALLALMCIYGIELLPDNVAECRANLLDTLFDYLGKGVGGEWFARLKLSSAPILCMQMPSTWRRRPARRSRCLSGAIWAREGSSVATFDSDALTQRSSIEGSLFEMLEDHDVFIPIRTYPPMTVAELAR
ncbi:MAG: hypothetical protein R2755_26120 [Acidimicrobiales bacterium]